MSGTLNVLVVSGGSFQGQALLNGLAASGGVRSVLADCFAQTVGGYLAHRSYTVPRVADEEAFIAALLTICARERIGVVFPSTDIELAALGANRAAFEDLGVCVAVSAPAWLDVVGDKGRLYAFLAENGFPVLPLAVPWSPEAVFPLLGKPRQGWGGRGHARVGSRTEWLALDREELRSTYVWQPYLENPDEFSVDFAIDFQGRLSALSIRKRVRTVGGFAVIATTEDDVELAALALRLAELTAARGGCGIFNVQVLSHRGGRFVSDVNPRIGTSAVFAYEEGINLPLFVCGLEVPADVPPARKTRTMVRRLEESFYVPVRLDDVVAVVFDLDDTLLRHKSWIIGKIELIHAEFERKLRPFDGFLHQALELLENGQRHRLFDALADVFDFSEALKRELIDAYRAAVPAAQLFADVSPVFAELRARGFKLALLTDNPPPSQRQKIEAAGLVDCFDEVVFSREAGGEKPAPAGFHEVARRLGISCDRLVMVGDDLFRDVRGALTAGYTHAFLVRREGGFHNHDLGAFRRIVPEATEFTTVPGLIDVLPYLRPGPLSVRGEASTGRDAK